MKKLQFVIVILCLALASCSTDNEQEPNTDGRQLRRLTIAEVPVTRAVLTDNTSSLSAVWKEGDKATYFNVTTFRENRMDTGLLTASENSITSAFTGSVYCETGDKVALFYPAQEVPTQGTNRGRFTINLDGQKGTLDDIAEHFHYVYGVAEVTSVTDNTASATIDNTKSMLALCKFSFTDGTSVIPVKTLTINYYDNNYCVTLGYPLSATLTPTADVDNLVLTYIDQSTWDEQELTITLASETSSGVYVALFPFSPTGYMHFSVTNDSGTYTGTAKATLKAGKYYPVTLNLTKNN